MTFVTNAQGHPYPILCNACVALKEEPALQGCIAFDEFASTIVVRAPLPWNSDAPRPWSKADDLAVAVWLQQQHRIRVSSSVAAEAVEHVAYENRFHPVRDWLNDLVWDEKPRIGEWLTTYLGAAPSDFTAAIGRMWLISAVARVMKPGCKADHMPILEGKQGTLKSTAIATLVGEAWFTDQIADFGSKDSCQDLVGKLVIEVSELSAMKPRDTEAVKAYVSRSTDHYRASYGRRSGDVPRQNVFIGTTNSSEYLVDFSGGRRFWPVACGKIDIDALRRDREQLWAEAVVAYGAGEEWWFDTEDLREAAADAQEERRIHDPWEQVIAEWLENPTQTGSDGVPYPYPIALAREQNGTLVSGPNGRSVQQITNAEILSHAIMRPVERQATSDQMRIGKILQGLGWQKRKATRAKRVVWEREVETPESGDEEGVSTGCLYPKPNGGAAQETVETQETPEGAGMRRSPNTYTANHDSGVSGVSTSLSGQCFCGVEGETPDRDTFAPGVSTCSLCGHPVDLSNGSYTAGKGEVFHNTCFKEHLQ